MQLERLNFESPSRFLRPQPDTSPVGIVTETVLPARPGDSFRRDTKDCHGKIRVFGHGDRGQGSHRWFVPDDDCCQKVNCTCPACVARWSRNKARKVRLKVERLNKALDLAQHPDRVSTLNFVFTLPKGFKTDDKKILAKLRKCARDVASKWVAENNRISLKSRSHAGWRFTGFDCIHPTGTTEDWHGHIHMELLSIAYLDVQAQPGPHKLSRSRFLPLRLKVSQADLVRLRAAWGEVLNSVIGWTPGQQLIPDPCTVGPPWPPVLSGCSVDYKWRTYREPGRLAHRIRYDTRHFPGWRGAFRQLAWFGYMSPAACKKIGLGVDDSNEPPDKLKQTHPTICPCCGAKSQVDIVFSSGADASLGKHQELLERQNAPPLLLYAETVFREPLAVKIWTD